MQGLRISLVVCMGLFACSKAGDHEDYVAEQSPYGELEVAQAEEVPERIDTSARRPSSPARRPVRKSLPTRPAPADSAPAGDSAANSDTADRSVTPGYEAYPIEPVPDTARPPRADTSTVARDRVAYPMPPTATQPAAASRAGVMVPAGTVIHAALEDSIHSRLDVPGRVVSAKVMQNVTGPDGRTLIPAGAPVQLTVTRVKPGRGDRQGLLEIRPDSVAVAGEARKLEATIQPVPYELRGRGVTGEEAAKVGVGAAGGAVVGRVLGGNTKGAVIGGVVGAAGGAVVASQTAAKDVVVKARTPVSLVLTAPVAVPPSSGGTTPPSPR
jgi:hypothetical protein